MVSYLFGLESMAYLTAGLVDRGVPDYSLESAICKVSGTEFLWYAANRALQLKGGAGYMRDQPYEKMLRDTRIFPIFEGANDVMRAFIALSGMKPLGERAQGAGGRRTWATRSARSACWPTTWRAGSSARCAPTGSRRPTRSSIASPRPVTDQVKRLAGHHGVAAARAQGRDRPSASSTRSAWPTPWRTSTRRSPCSRGSTRIFEEHGVEPSGQERYIAETFCTRAARRVEPSLDQVESNDDERMIAIAKLAYKRGEYGYAFFED